ncbi:MAG: DUF87 domain-containing protein [Planctomycetes bacterium]|nr:DUF87 domain-containing protein [Planctomycetota bacterium]MBI3833916.1 DUF87 domain-containing protein [Planctomycetota bacterium]
MPLEFGKSARVQELCRKLKPIIGERAERIWLAFLAEDEDGKAQIVDYLELLSAQHFRESLESQGPGLIPPNATQAAGEFELGQVSYNNRDLFPFGLREGEWTQHVGVFGRSGAGKTNLGFLLVQKLIEVGKPVLIFDWKRNYRDLLPLPGFEDVAVYSIGRSIAPFSFNPLIPPPETSPKTWLKKLIQVIAHAYLLGNGVLYMLQETIDRVYEEAGVYSGHIERWPTLRDVLELLKKRSVSGREAGWAASALRALASLSFGEMDVLVNQGHDDIASLLTRPVILELDALTQSDKVFVVQALLLWIHHLRMVEPTRETFKHAIVIEEAHHILSGERQSLLGGQSVMEITFREIREFGEAMVILDQHPSQISMPALGNTYCTICFNLKHRTDVNAMSQAMLLQDEEKNILGELQVGDAVVRLQGRSVKPFLIKVPEFIIHKGLFDDAKVRHHMTRLGLLAVRDHPIVRTSVAENYGRDLHGQVNTMHRMTTRDNNDFLEGGADGLAAVHDGKGESLTRRLNDGGFSKAEVAMLQDIATFPEAGIAERYKRLGWSVRQGQRVKQRLLAQGMVTEELKTTPRGNMRVVRLTEKGRGVVEGNAGL